MLPEYENHAKKFKLKQMKKLTCHCEEVEIQVRLPETGFEKLMRCNCSLCKRRGYIMTPVSPENFKIIKGKNFLTLYQYHTKVAEHYFCSKCGIYTHSNPRSNHDKVFMLNVACIEGVKPFELENIKINDGTNHPLDKKQ